MQDSTTTKNISPSYDILLELATTTHSFESLNTIKCIKFTKIAYKWQWILSKPNSLGPTFVFRIDRCSVYTSSFNKHFLWWDFILSSVYTHRNLFYSGFGLDRLLCCMLTNWDKWLTFLLRQTRCAAVINCIEYRNEVSIPILVRTVNASSLISTSSSSHL
jgi:hypothetical protein